MHVSPIADMADSIFFLFEGIQIGIAIYLFTVILEGVAMRYMEWGTFGQCMIDSFIMNGVSLGFGLILVVLLFFVPLIQAIAGYMLVGFPNVMLSYLIGWILTVLIEGGTLLVLRNKPTRLTLRMMFIVNTLSYVGLIIAYLIFLA